jgi:hypothetical protein
MFACRSNDRHVRVAISDDGSALFELLQQSITRRFPFVVDVWFVGKTEDEDSASFDSLAAVMLYRCLSADLQMVHPQ